MAVIFQVEVRAGPALLEEPGSQVGRPCPQGQALFRINLVSDEMGKGWGMETLRERVLRCLRTYEDEDTRLIQELGQIIDENGTDAYLVIFEIITQLQLDPEKAKLL